MRKILLPITFFAFTPLIIVLSIVQFAYLSSVKSGSLLFSFLPHKTQNIAYAALPTNIEEVSGTVGVSDARVGEVCAFFHSYGSILENYCQQIVTASDQNNLDYRLLPALAMQESQGCEKIPDNSYNCWGYGITKTQTMKFGSYDEAIDTVAKSLNKYYSSKGLITVEQIGPKWNPTNKDNWIDKVNFFMEQIK